MTAPRPLAHVFLLAGALTLLAAGSFSQSDIDGQQEPGEQQAIAVGDTLSPDQLHIIEDPGLYGLGLDLDGCEYAVAQGQLVRVQADTLKVLSILREQTDILD